MRLDHFFRNAKRATTKTHAAGKPRNLRFEGLERRQLMAAGVSLVGGELRISADSSHGVAAEVREISATPGAPNPNAKLTVTVADALSKGPKTYTFSENAVSRIVFEGSDMPDRFEDFAKASWIPSIVNGKGGADFLRGGAGKNTIHGGNGNDSIYGGAGADTLYGDGGADYLNGFGGKNTLYGNAGADTFVCINNSVSDILYGGDGNDSFWVDRTLVIATPTRSPFSYTDQVADLSSFEQTYNYHPIVSFANGADKTLDGERIADPTGANNYHQFSNHPLFASSGPSQFDVYQGALGDCWLLATLGSSAQTDQNSIRQTVVDLGDETYAVELGGKYFRVDDDLPMRTSTSTTPCEAGFGREGCIWTPIVEKAYAFYRPNHGGFSTGSYSVLNGGFPKEAFEAIGCSGFVSKSFTGGVGALNHIASELHLGKAVTVVIKTPSTSSLVGNHVYMVESVNYAMIGHRRIAVSVVLRNPWGHDNKDFVNNTWASYDGNDDGMVTISANDLAASMWGGDQGVQSAWV
jgi:hypothetical protein